MAPPRKIYRGSLVEGASVPSVDFSQFKVQAPRMEPSQTEQTGSRATSEELQKLIQKYQ